jgi:hypothetical protein
MRPNSDDQVEVTRHHARSARKWSMSSGRQWSRCSRPRPRLIRWAVTGPGPLRREGHRPQPTDRAKLGWRWSVAAGLDQFEIQRRGTRVPGVKRQPLRLGRRWIVEATNTWRSNYGQLRRNTDRRARHRHAALCRATTVLIVGRLIDWRNRWNST